MKKYNYKYFWIFTIVISCILFCAFIFKIKIKQKFIKIGLCVQLSGPGAELGLGVRNGARLAVDKINANGGVAGKKIILLVKDDQGKPTIAKQKDLELIKQGVVAIIGHITSSVSIAAVPIANKHKTVLLSPTTSTPALKNKDDYFFRINTISEDEAKFLANFAFNHLKLNRIGIIWDKKNVYYSKYYAKSFTQAFNKLGGNVLFSIGYDKPNSINLSLEKITPQFKIKNILFICSDIDLLTFIKSKFRYISYILASGWPMTPTLTINKHLLENKNIFFASSTPPKKNQKEIMFEKSYKKTYGFSPVFSAVKGYDAVRLIVKALQINPNNLKKGLLKIKNFPGIQYKITFNKYGDIKTPTYIYQIKNGHFIHIKYDK
ncbi:ABC transporter substrate-binding protein [Desulfonauticus submarinus]